MRYSRSLQKEFSFQINSMRYLLIFLVVFVLGCDQRNVRTRFMIDETDIVPVRVLRLNDSVTFVKTSSFRNENDTATFVFRINSLKFIDSKGSVGYSYHPKAGNMGAAEKLKDITIQMGNPGQSDFRSLKKEILFEDYKNKFLRFYLKGDPLETDISSFSQREFFPDFSSFIDSINVGAEIILYRNLLRHDLPFIPYVVFSLPLKNSKSDEYEIVVSLLFDTYTVKSKCLISVIN